MVIEPLYERVLLRREKADKIGAVYLPEQHAKNHATTLCEVVGVGPDVNNPERCKTEIRIGMKVLIGQYAGTWINELGMAVADPNTAEYYLVKDEDLLAEITDE